MGEIVNFVQIAKKLTTDGAYDGLDGTRFTESLIRDAKALAVEFLRLDEMRREEIHSISQHSGDKETGACKGCGCPLEMSRTIDANGNPEYYDCEQCTTNPPATSNPHRAEVAPGH